MNEVADENALVGPVDGTFCFKKRTDGSVDKRTVVCKLCRKEFAYHRSLSSLKYHLNAKHVAASIEINVTPSTTTSVVVYMFWSVILSHTHEHSHTRMTPTLGSPPSN